MAVIYPGADYQPLGPQTEPLMTAHDIICLHTMVGSLQSTDNYFEQDGYGGVESHFGTGYDGETIQWQDLSRQADANLEGNPRLISIETADSGTGFPVWSGENVPAWTEAQLAALIDLIAWLCVFYHIPAELVPDSKPGRRGIGYHRQGINPWRVSGGELWSESNGKVCPGDRRINQLKTVVIPAVQDILNGEPMPTGAEIWDYNINDKLRDDVPDRPDNVPHDAQAYFQILRTKIYRQGLDLTKIKSDLAAIKTLLETPAPAPGTVTVGAFAPEALTAQAKANADETAARMAS